MFFIIFKNVFHKSGVQVCRTSMPHISYALASSDCVFICSFFLFFLGPPDIIEPSMSPVHPAAIISFSPSFFPSSFLFLLLLLLLLLLHLTRHPWSTWWPPPQLLLLLLLSLSLSFRWAGLLQMIIQMGRFFANDHPDGPAFSNDHPDGLAFCKWSYRFLPYNQILLHFSFYFQQISNYSSNKHHLLLQNISSSSSSSNLRTKVQSF